MSCPGLHCPGCSGGQSIGVLVGAVLGAWVAYEAFEVVREYIWWIGGTLAVCFALSVAVCMWLAGLTACREEAFAAVLAARRDRETLTAAAEPQVTRGTEVPVVEYHVHHHYYADSREAARVIPGKVLP